MRCSQPLCQHMYVERRDLLDKDTYRKNHNIQVDPCIAPLVLALNAAGLHTVGSCCGHGVRQGSIVALDNIGVGSLETIELILHPTL